MTDTNIANYRNYMPQPRQRKYTVNILEAVEKRVGKDQFTITDIVVCTTTGSKHRFSVSLKVGMCLYLFINSKGRTQRMNGILFNLTVDTDSQKVIESLAYDSSEWIGDAMERAGKLPRPQL